MLVLVLALGALLLYTGLKLPAADEIAGTAQSRFALIIASLVAMGLAVLVIAPIGFVSVRRFSERLQDFTDTMLAVSRNDLKAAIPLAEGDDEISDMARALSVFRANAISLIAHQDQVEKLNFQIKIALNNMSRGISMFDAEERLVISNDVFRSMYDMPPALTRSGTPIGAIIAHREARGRIIGDKSDCEVARWHDLYARNVLERKPFSITYGMDDGRTIQISYEPLSDGGCVALHEDVTEKRRAEDHIRQLAQQDSLTGIANRLHFKEHLNRAITESEGGGGFAIHLVDLDRFKEVNDTLGHPAGDELIRMVANRLLSNMRNGDLVARLGGDEFAVLQRNLTNETHARALAERLMPALSRDYAIQGQRVRIGASIGVALGPGDGTDADEVIRKADIALYRAKSLGRGNIVVFESELETKLKQRKQLENALRDAIGLGQFEVHFQPIHDAGTGEVCCCEALARWRLTDGSFVSPGAFIPIAEETGLISQIGAFVLETACRQALGWPETVGVAVNLSAVQFERGHVANLVERVLRETGLDPMRLTLEVTETLLLEDEPSTRDTLSRLQEIGVSIALDDFGTGYSSLSYLRSFSFDYIKIDRSFIADLEPCEMDEVPSGRRSRGRQAAVILRAVAGLARELGIVTVAEGIETELQLAAVRSFGCTKVQGFLLSRPMTGDAITQRLTCRAGSQEVDCEADTLAKLA